MRRNYMLADTLSTMSNHGGSQEVVEGTANYAEVFYEQQLAEHGRIRKKVGFLRRSDELEETIKTIL